MRQQVEPHQGYRGQCNQHGPPVDGDPRSWFRHDLSVLRRGGALDYDTMPCRAQASCQTIGMPDFLGSAPVLPARDIAAAIEWFQRKLGFEAEFEYPAENPAYAIVSRDGTEIHLRALPVDAANNLSQCYVGVQGIDELYHEYVVRGVIHAGGELEFKPWGQREFSVLELNGATIVFGETSSVSEGL